MLLASTKTGKVYPIKQTVNCNSDKVIYLVTCKKCTINMWDLLVHLSKWDFETTNHQW